MTDSTKKRAYIARRFTDRGTGETFAAGATPLLDAGTYANYEAAGLIGTPLPAPKIATKPKPTTKDKPASKTKAKPKAAPAPVMQVAPIASPATDPEPVASET